MTFAKTRNNLLMVRICIPYIIIVLSCKGHNLEVSDEFEVPDSYCHLHQQSNFLATAPKVPNKALFIAIEEVKKESRDI